MKIPYLSLRDLNALYQAEIEAATLDVVRSGYYLNSPAVAEFEESWAAYCHARYCVSTANGLDALTAILVAMRHLYGWASGSEVIVSAHTFIASFEAITRSGLTPVPCDVDPTTCLIDTTLIEPLITPHTVAIMPVHLYGRVCDMEAIAGIAEAHKLRVVADACQAHGMCRNGDLGDAAAFSFYPGKNLGALGDGGCLVTDNADIAQYARAYCNYGAQVKYHHEIKGINSRLDAVQAAILQAKLPCLDDANRQRQLKAERYNEAVSNPLIALPYGGDADAHLSNWHIYPIFTSRRDELQAFLADRGIQTLIHYPIPPHKQGAYVELVNAHLPVSERLCAQELSLPLNPVLTNEQQDYVINALNEFN